MSSPQHGLWSVRAIIYRQNFPWNVFRKNYYYTHYCTIFVSPFNWRHTLTMVTNRPINDNRFQNLFFSCFWPNQYIPVETAAIWCPCITINQAPYHYYFLVHILIMFTFQIANLNWPLRGARRQNILFMNASILSRFLNVHFFFMQKVFVVCLLLHCSRM